MKKHIFKITILSVVLGLFTLTSCLNDLDTLPSDDDIALADEVFDDPSAYKQVLAKLYAGLAISGQQGPAGLPDISGIDEGFSQYLRQYWLAQEVTTDEAVIGWADGSLPDYHEQDWNSSNEFITALYNRIYYQIKACNTFLNQTTPDLLSGRGVEGSLLTEVNTYRAEARFLRALSYYHALDLFGNVPFTDENDPVGYWTPEQISRADLFNYVESELLAIENELIAPKSNEYARADQAAAWTLLAKLYLNAEVYTGEAKYTEAITYANKVINAGFSLESNYENLFLADNHTANGVIFPIAFDGLHTQTYGGTTFLIHAAVGGTMSATDFGINSGWGGTRTTSSLVNLFNYDFNVTAANNAIGAPSNWGIVGDLTDWGGQPDLTLYQTGTANVLQAYYQLPDAELKFRPDNAWGSDFGDNGNNINVTAGLYKITINTADQTYSIDPLADSRAMFHTDGQNLEIANIPTFTEGYAITKFKNVDRAGNAGSDDSGNFTDTDFPLFRLADVYLIYAEAVLRGGSGGDEATAIGYINELRTRANSPVQVSSIDLDLILDERARELYWEGHRRTDLIRYGKFTSGDYVWPWKGGVINGTSTPSYLNLFPIPSTDINANPNLTQNDGY
ncbi:RagB/SusD family nutrient uptake outer membrane protein [Aureibaculum marinum]|uniref:RagB/SusD family nutrient uptake outer membrane protein n=1 Tax=Aureibaculum marinum TaxID=2487930 RepID=A0A3N4NZC3_9FLAO|nr:RagB/SusD family nutrient uptake outer membrane protein [Aureibaculum marinum]RPE00178.1 RagB/SusD family nutrient uptake outer membrane protein [Aureibaculum marinum]